jgi:hypothetical protein
MVADGSSPAVVELVSYRLGGKTGSVLRAVPRSFDSR